MWPMRELWLVLPVNGTAQQMALQCCHFHWPHAACPRLLWAPPFLEKGYKSVRFPMGPDPVCSLYPTGLHQTIPSAYPVPSIHLHVAFPKTRENGSCTDLLLIACKRDEKQYTSDTSV